MSLHCLFYGSGEENNSKCQQMHLFIIFAHNLLRSSLGHDAVFTGPCVTPKWRCFRTRIHAITFQ